MALVRTGVMRRLSLVLVVIWLLQGIVYLGLPLSANAFRYDKRFSPWWNRRRMEGMEEGRRWELTQVVWTSGT